MVDPAKQAKGIGKQLLKAYVRTTEAEYVTTYTRNPAVIQMIAAVCILPVYPVSKDTELYAIAQSMPHASSRDGLIIHAGRYGDGLYPIAQDPALAAGSDGQRFADAFPVLADPGNALIVAAKITKER